MFPSSLHHTHKPTIISQPSLGRHRCLFNMQRPLYWKECHVHPRGGFNLCLGHQTKTSWTVLRAREREMR